MATSHTPTHAMGSQTISTAGTAVRLHATSLRARRVLVYAQKANSGQLFVGGSDVASSTSTGLDGGESITLETDKNFLDLYDIWVDVGTNGDKADFYAQKV